MFGLKDNHIRTLKACFKKYPKIETVIVYGSRAKGNYRPGSDIDLTIIGNNIAFSELLKLENEIDDLLLPYKIDLSIKGDIANADLISHIDRVGKVFYSKEDLMQLNELDTAQTKE